MLDFPLQIIVTSIHLIITHEINDLFSQMSEEVKQNAHKSKKTATASKERYESESSMHSLCQNHMLLAERSEDSNLERKLQKYAIDVESEGGYKT